MVFTVSKLTNHIVQLFEQDDRLRNVQVIGEVSNWRRAASGHIYFRLKDEGATLNAVMWKSHALAQSWLPKEGDQVIAHGYVGVYPEGGAYQLYTSRLIPAGRGQLYAQFEALKERLRAAGLFDEARKRPLPRLPTRLAVVTSPDAAALRDILRTLTVRWPLVEVILFPTLVQGVDAAQHIVAAIVAANRYSSEVAPIDVLILARGGGSIEDLWAFNEEPVAIAVAQSSIPVISGVGHETDFTIVDFVADLRAATPTAAAVAAVQGRLDHHTQAMARMHTVHLRVRQRLDQERRAFQRLWMRLQRIHPQRQLDQARLRLDERERRLHQAMRRALAQREERLRAAAQRLEALNPLRVLARGYSIVQRADGAVVSDPAMVHAGELLTVRAAGGQYRVEVRDEEARG